MRLGEKVAEIRILLPIIKKGWEGLTIYEKDEALEKDEHTGGYEDKTDEFPLEDGWWPILHHAAEVMGFNLKPQCGNDPVLAGTTPQTIWHIIRHAEQFLELVDPDPK